MKNEEQDKAKSKVKISGRVKAIELRYGITALVLEDKENKGSYIKVLPSPIFCNLRVNVGDKVEVHGLKSQHTIASAKEE